MQYFLVNYDTTLVCFEYNFAAVFVVVHGINITFHWIYKCEYVFFHWKIPLRLSNSGNMSFLQCILLEYSRNFGPVISHLETIRDWKWKISVVTTSSQNDEHTVKLFQILRLWGKKFWEMKKERLPEQYPIYLMRKYSTSGTIAYSNKT